MLLSSKLDCLNYVQKESLIEIVLKYIMSIKWSEKKVGQYEVPGTEAYLVFTANELREDNNQFECHRRYMDLHYIIDGDEEIKYCPIGYLKQKSEYNAVKDFCLYEGDDYSKVILHVGEWVVFFPEDGHAPGIKHTTGKCLKVIAKIPVFV